MHFVCWSFQYEHDWRLKCIYPILEDYIDGSRMFVYKCKKNGTAAITIPARTHYMQAKQLWVGAVTMAIGKIGFWNSAQHTASYWNIPRYANKPDENICLSWKSATIFSQDPANICHGLNNEHTRANWEIRTHM